MVSIKELLTASSGLIARADPERSPALKAVGISLAFASGFFIGVSAVIKKKGLLLANQRYHTETGDGFGYFKVLWWWLGMATLIVGELCNLGAYVFVPAVIVTPLGAVSIVVTAVLSAILLKERMSFVEQVACFNALVGSVIIVLNAPEQPAITDIDDMRRFVVNPAFLGYSGFVVGWCVLTIFWLGPRYGKKYMLIYLSICSLLGGITVAFIQGIGAAFSSKSGGREEWGEWLLYVMIVIVVITGATQIIFFNKALNIFNTAIVMASYYVFFTSSTFVTSAVLFRGFKATPIAIATIVLSFAQISGSVLSLQWTRGPREIYEDGSSMETALISEASRRYDPEMEAVMADRQTHPPSVLHTASRDPV